MERFLKIMILTTVAAFGVTQSLDYSKVKYENMKQQNQNDTLFKKNPFLAGLYIGTVHGVVNQAAEKILKKDEKTVSRITHFVVYYTTRSIANRVANSYEPATIKAEVYKVLKSSDEQEKLVLSYKTDVINEDYKKILLGRALGQSVTEYVGDYARNGKWSKAAIVNTSMIECMYLYALEAVRYLVPDKK